MSEQRKRLIRSRKKGSENIPLEPQTPIVPSQPIQQPQQQPIQEQPKTQRDILFAEDTQTCNLTIEDIKAGVVRVYAEGSLEPFVIKLPKSLALAIRMAYREGLNSSKKPQIITTKQTKEELGLMRAAEEMANYLRRLGTTHGKTEQDLIDAVRILKEARRRPPNLPEY